MSARSEWEEGSSSTKEDIKEDDQWVWPVKSKMSFEPIRHSVDQSMSLDRTVIIGYKTRTISEPIYEDELLKNLTIEICYEATNTNPNSIYIPTKICLEEYNINMN